MITTINEFNENLEQRKNNVQAIMSDMIHISNNSQMTQIMANKLASELSPESFVALQQWLRHAKSQQDIKIQQTKRRF